MLRSRTVDRWPILELTVLYGVGTGLWLLLSNHLLPAAIQDPTRLIAVQTVLDLGYGALTSGLFYWLLRYTARTGERATRALADERNLLRTVIENLPDYIFVKDRNSRYVMNNAAHLRQFRATAQAEVSGKTDFDFHATELAARYHADDLAVLTLGQPLLNQIEPTVDHLGHPIWVRTTKVPLRDSLGVVIGLVGIVHDVTEIKRADEALRRAYDVLERRVDERTAELSEANAILRREIAERKRVEAKLQSSEAELRALLAAMHDPIFVLNREGRYLRVAPINPDVLVLPPDELVGHTIRDLFPEQADCFVGYIAQALVTGTTVNAEYNLRFREADHWFMASISPLSTDTVVWVAHNFTERKQMEQALRAAHNELEDRVQERTAALSDSNAQLQAEIAERQRVEQMERDQRVLAEALRDSAAALNSTLNLDEVLDRILDNVERVVHHDVANIMLIENGITRVVRLRGYETLGEGVPEEVKAVRFPVDETANLRHMMDVGKWIIIPDVRAYPGWGKSSTVSYLGAPIRLGQEIIGFLALDSLTPGFFSELDAERLQAFADQAAIAIQNARLYSQAQAFATLQERQRLARDLHDAVSQTLFSASVIAESLPRLLTRDTTKVERGLTQLHQLTRGALAEMRALLVELYPAELVETDLSDLLRQLADSLASRTTTAIDLFVENVGPLPPDVQMALYRIAQEALNNVARHARATQVIIQLVGRAAGVEIHFTDDGCGFDETQAYPTHFGLANMRERAASIGAALAIRSHPGHGTDIILTWRRAKS